MNVPVKEHSILTMQQGGQLNVVTLDTSISTLVVISADIVHVGIILLRKEGTVMSNEHKLNWLVLILLVACVGYLVAVDAVGAKKTVLGLVNESRSGLALSVVSESEALNSSAAAKCEDMTSKDYWAHSGGGSVWSEFIANEFRGKGEILARGFENNTNQHKAWLDSPTHYSVMMGLYNYAGWAECRYSNGDRLVVVHFGLK